MKTNEKYQEYFMGPVVDATVEIIEEYTNYTVRAKVNGVEKHVRLSPFGGEFVWKPAHGRIAL